MRIVRGEKTISGGRMTKWKGRAASLSPTIGQLVASVSPAALATALAVAVPITVYSTSSAEAQACSFYSGTYYCAGIQVGSERLDGSNYAVGDAINADLANNLVLLGNTHGMRIEALGGEDVNVNPSYGYIPLNDNTHVFGEDGSGLEIVTDGIGEDGLPGAVSVRANGTFHGNGPGASGIAVLSYFTGTQSTDIRLYGGQAQGIGSGGITVYQGEDGGNVFIETFGDAYTYGIPAPSPFPPHGIGVFHQGTGTTTINTYGQTEAIGEDAVGIAVMTGEDAGNVAIRTNGSTYGEGTGIGVATYGASTVDIDVYAPVSSRGLGIVVNTGNEGGAVDILVDAPGDYGEDGPIFLLQNGPFGPGGFGEDGVSGSSGIVVNNYGTSTTDITSYSTIRAFGEYFQGGIYIGEDGPQVQIIEREGVGIQVYAARDRGQSIFGYGPPAPSGPYGTSPGDITIESFGSIIARHHGIEVDNFGTGNVDIVTHGLIDAGYGPGAPFYNGPGYLNVLNFNYDGPYLGEDGPGFRRAADAINVFNGEDGGNVDIHATNYAALYGTNNGIVVTNYGEDATTTIRVDGDVRGNGYVGEDLMVRRIIGPGPLIGPYSGGVGINVFAGNGTGNIDIDAGTFGEDFSSTVFGQNTGIRVLNHGEGGIDIDTADTGLYGRTSVVGEDGFGIMAVNEDSFGFLFGEDFDGTPTDITITTGEVTGGQTGILAWNEGTGTTTITTYGAVNGNGNQFGPPPFYFYGEYPVYPFSDSFGIVAVGGPQSGNISITTNDEVNGEDGGVLAINAGYGNVTVNTIGDVTATGGEDSFFGVFAANAPAELVPGLYGPGSPRSLTDGYEIPSPTAPGKDVTVTTGNVYGGQIGVGAYNFGYGSTTVTTNGTVTGTQIGTSTLHVGYGDLTVNVNGSTYGGNIGLYNSSEGLGGTFNIAVDATLDGGEDAFVDGSGNHYLDDYFGEDAPGNPFGSTLNVYGSLLNDAHMGAGEDTINVFGGATIAPIADLDGDGTFGEDTTGFDTLNFRNWDDSIGTNQIDNFEVVNVIGGSYTVFTGEDAVLRNASGMGFELNIGEDSVAAFAQDTRVFGDVNNYGGISLQYDGSVGTRLTIYGDMEAHSELLIDADLASGGGTNNNLPDYDDDDDLGDDRFTDQIVIFGDTYGDPTQVVVNNTTPGVGSNTELGTPDAVIDHHEGLLFAQVRGEDGLSGNSFVLRDGPIELGAFEFDIYSFSPDESDSGYWEYVLASTYRDDTAIYQSFLGGVAAGDGMPTFSDRFGNRFVAGGSGPEATRDSTRELTISTGGMLDEAPAPVPTQADNSTGLFLLLGGEYAEVDPISSTTGATFDVRQGDITVGVDMVLGNGGGGDIIAGAFVQGAQTNIDATSIFGSGSADSMIVSAGATLSFISDADFYVDAVVKYGQITTDFEDISGISTASDVEGTLMSASLEVGQRIRTGDNMSVTPQLQFKMTDVDYDPFTDSAAATITVEDGMTSTARAGAVFEYGTGTPTRFYALANLMIDLDGETVVDVDGTDLVTDTAQTHGELGIGASHSWQSGNSVNTVFGEVRGRQGLEKSGNSALSVNAGWRIDF